MFERQLLDLHENRNYFVYMSNRSIQETFPMVSDSPKTIYNRASEEIHMGYSTLNDL